jgi:hypothetical protein
MKEHFLGENVLNQKTLERRDDVRQATGNRREPHDQIRSVLQEGLRIQLLKSTPSKGHFEEELSDRLAAF